MRPPLLMFDETAEWDDLDVRVVIEVDGDSVEGRAQGDVTLESRFEIVARASLDAAGTAAGVRFGDLVGVTTGDIRGVTYVAVAIIDPITSDPLVGSAPMRHFEDGAQAVIRAVFDAVNRRAGAF